MDAVVEQPRPEARSAWGTGRAARRGVGSRRGRQQRFPVQTALRWLLIRGEANGTLTGKERAANERPERPDALQ